MSMEIILIFMFAAAKDLTLILALSLMDQPLYLLKADSKIKEKQQRETACEL